MSVVVATTRVACNTATGNQNITTSKLGGLTPKAALFVVTRAVTDGTAADHAVLSFGACDDTNEWVVSETDEHGQDTTDGDCYGVDSRCIWINVPGELMTSDGAAYFSTFITNGVTIYWDDAPASAYLLTVTFFAGSDLSVHAGVEGLGDTVDLATDVTAPGFEPTVLICVTPLVFSGQISATGSYGFVHWDGVSTVTQRCVGHVFRPGVDTTANACWVRNDCAAYLLSGTGNLDWYGEAGSFDSSGFTITTRNSGANNTSMAYLALAFNGAVDSYVGTYTTPSGGGGGNDSETGIGFPPQAVVLIPTLVETINTKFDDNRAGTFGLSVFDDTDEYCTTITSEDAADISNTQSLSDDQALNVPDHDGTLEYSAAFVSMDSSGFTLNYGTEPSTAKLMPMLAIEAEAAGVPKQAMHYARLRRAA